MTMTAVMVQHINHCHPDELYIIIIYFALKSLTNLDCFCCSLYRDTGFKADISWHNMLGTFNTITGIPKESFFKIDFESDSRHKLNLWITWYNTFPTLGTNRLLLSGALHPVPPSPACNLTAVATVFKAGRYHPSLLRNIDILRKMIYSVL